MDNALRTCGQSRKLVSRALVALSVKSTGLQGRTLVSIMLFFLLMPLAPAKAAELAIVRKTGGYELSVSRDGQVVPLQVQSRLSLGEYVWAGPDSFVEIKYFSDGCIFRVQNGELARIARVSPCSPDDGSRQTAAAPLTKSDLSSSTNSQNYKPAFVARVTSVSGPLPRADFGTGLVELRMGSRLRIGDTVFAGQDSDVTLFFPGGNCEFNVTAKTSLLISEDPPCKSSPQQKTLEAGGGAPKEPSGSGRLYNGLSVASAARPADTSASFKSPNWSSVYAGLGLGAGYSGSQVSSSGYGDFRPLADSVPGGTYLELTDNRYADQSLFLCDNHYGSCGGTAVSYAGYELSGGFWGALAQIEVGGDLQLGRIVAGLDVFYRRSGSSLSVSGGGGGSGVFYADDGTTEGVLIEGGGSGNVSVDLELGGSWGGGGRLGFLVTESNLVFVSGGLSMSNAHMNATFDGHGLSGSEVNSAVLGNFNISAQADEWLSAFYMGGGFETLITPNVSLKIEYRYSNLGSIEVSQSASSAACLSPCASWAVEVGAQAEIVDNSVVATLSYRL